MLEVLWWFAFFTCQLSQACEAALSAKCHDLGQRDGSPSFPGEDRISTPGLGPGRLEAAHRGTAGNSLLQMKSWPARPAFTPFDDFAEYDIDHRPVLSSAHERSERGRDEHLHLQQANSSSRAAANDAGAPSLEYGQEWPSAHPTISEAPHLLAFFFQGARGHVASRAVGLYIVLTVVAFIFLFGCLTCCLMTLLKQPQQKDSRHRGSGSRSRRHYGGGASANLLLRAQPAPGSPPMDAPTRVKRSPMFTTPLSVGGSASSGEPVAPSKGLCPGLVVPESSECVLSVETSEEKVLTSAGHSLKRLDILDLAGQVVLQAQVLRPWPKRPDLSQAEPIVVLRTMKQPEPLASSQGSSAGSSGDPGRLSTCWAGTEDGLNPCVRIRDKDDVMFGNISHDPSSPRYVLTNSRGDLRVFFEGAFKEHTVKVMNERQELLSHTEPITIPSRPASSFYQVRIASGVDVGLILSGLLSLDAIEEASMTVSPQASAQRIQAVARSRESPSHCEAT
mmetsp:Transcript_95743/g.166326  ORF Transcript_95743/g.166326 Transcript_95743/m.166326 type:complete len:506 (+) Transcript_95743:144-1661(+)